MAVIPRERPRPAPEVAPRIALAPVHGGKGASDSSGATFGDLADQDMDVWAWCNRCVGDDFPGPFKIPGPNRPPSPPSR